MQNSGINIGLVIILVTIILLLLGFFIVFMLMLYQNKQAVYKKQIEDVKNHYQNILLKTELEIKEQTLQMVSREIHDNINLNLTLLKLRFNTWDEKNSSRIDFLSESAQILGNTISDLTDISRTLDTNVIKEQGLISAIKMEVSKIQSLSQLKIEPQIIGTAIYMDSKKELIVFRVIQECFNNIVKHANAKKVSVALDYCAEFLNIEIIDDGIGFHVHSIESDSGKRLSSGIKNMKARIGMFNGVFKIESDLGKGSRVSIKIPLYEK